MNIIEQAIVGKRNQQECEDGIAVNDNFIAVIDGSTSKTPLTINPGMRNGRYCMELIKDYIGKALKDIDLNGFCLNITKIIYSEYEKKGLDIDRLQQAPTERLTASAIIYSHYRKQIWMIGDCQCIANNTFYENPKPQEQPLAERRSAFLHDVIKKGMNIEDIQSNDPGRTSIMHDLINSCKEQNIAYAVIDGFEIPYDKIKIIDVVDNDKDIILASDGYPILKNTLKKSEHELAIQLSKDPLCINQFKATKGLMKGNISFDDRSYIRFRE